MINFAGLNDPKWKNQPMKVIFVVDSREVLRRIRSVAGLMHCGIEEQFPSA